MKNEWMNETLLPSRLTPMTQSRAAMCFKRSVFLPAYLIGSDGLLEGAEIKHGS